MVEQLFNMFINDGGSIEEYEKCTVDELLEVYEIYLKEGVKCTQNMI